MNRTKRINVRATEAEHRMLGELAEEYGMQQSDVIRLWIRRTHAELFGPPTPPKQRRKRR